MEFIEIWLVLITCTVLIRVLQMYRDFLEAMEKDIQEFKDVLQKNEDRIGRMEVDFYELARRLSTRSETTIPNLDSSNSSQNIFSKQNLTGGR